MRDLHCDVLRVHARVRKLLQRLVRGLSRMYLRHPLHGGFRSLQRVSVLRMSIGPVAPRGTKMFHSIRLSFVCLMGVLNLLITACEPHAPHEEFTNLVFPNTDFSGRGFDLELEFAVGQGDGRRRVYATELDPYFYTFKEALFRLCVGRVHPRFDVLAAFSEDPDGGTFTPLSGTASSLPAWQEDALRCGSQGLERASTLLCMGYEALSLADTSSERSLVTYGSGGLYVVRVEQRGISTSLGDPWTTLARHMVPPQGAHLTDPLIIRAELRCVAEFFVGRGR
jgi:hypothetical protein